MKKEDLAADLLTWFHRVKRDLPWRRKKDPYHIWVSEIMLQQTRVDTVIPYFERFINRFPTLQSLSEASEDEVLKHWEGLGYYSRARNLHAAVKEVEATYGGVVPDQEEEISTLKGIGPYTKGAILSIAYNKPIPAVDGNVLRVISRIFAIEKDIARQATRTEFEDVVREIIPIEDPSGFNQALMELGALICIPRNPKCSICPVQAHCVGKAVGKEKILPIKIKKETKRDVHLVTVVYLQGEQLLIHQRQEQLLKGLWEFPSWEKEKELKINAELLTQSGYERYGVDVERFRYLGNIKHVFSHLRWNMEIYLADVSQIVNDISTEDQSYRWVNIGNLQDYPFPVPHQKVISLIATAIKQNKEIS